MRDISFVKMTVASRGFAQVNYDTSIELTDDIVYGRSGLALLVQLVMKWLYQTPGQDVVTPDIGGGLLNLTRIGPTSEGLEQIKYNITMAVLSTEDSIKKYQVGKNYPLDEQLESLAIDPDLGIIFDRDELKWRIKLILRTLAGDSATLGVGIKLGDTSSSAVGS